ncbi:hypothetical protein V5O48_017787 [Marasmius crinis-equi]|uniref:Uncharacterized protein n=1 Tax=Marasmius crinis-equi TaxID=585013 RepID=A0ABR3EN18_9AGAR
MQRVDDGDQARLTYSGKDWKSAFPRKEAEYKWTSHGTANSGSFVTFPFNGTAVQVRGTIHPWKSEQLPRTTFNLDSSPNEITFVGTPTNDTQYNQLFFNTSQLQVAEHSLRMTFLNPESVLWLDYIDYMPTTSQTSTAPAQASQNHTSKGLAVGISVLATVVFSGIVLGGLWWLRRRRLRRSGSEADQTQVPARTNVEISQYHVEPYVYPTSSVPPKFLDHSDGSGKVVHASESQINHSTGSGPSRGPTSQVAQASPAVPSVSQDEDPPPRYEG